MRVDYTKQQQEIKNYIETNFPLILAEINLEDMSQYVDDFIDFDKYIKNRTLFYDFGNYNYSTLSNESNTEELVFSVYLAFRDKKVANLRDTMTKYASAFYEMFERGNGNLNGLSDFGLIETVRFYNATEANISIKMVELEVRLKTER